ncbi:hypothetical protein GQX74_008496 [Glossina fuscipes]|nr:hypothetical protein GQX74_008496 [Glossina fuscipes]
MYAIDSSSFVFLLKALVLLLLTNINHPLTHYHKNTIWIEKERKLWEISFIRIFVAPSTIWNIPLSESKPETARDNIFNPYNSCGIDNNNHHQLTANKSMAHGEHLAHQNSINSMKSIDHCSDSNVLQSNHCNMNIIINENSSCDSHSSTSASLANTLTATTITSTTTGTTISTTITTNATSSIRKRQLCSSNIDNDLEILDRELSAINSPMPLIDPEITQGAEQLEKAISSRKRQRSEDESDRLVREALSQFYIPPQRLISAIEDCPLDIVNMGSISPKCPKMPNGSNDLELDFDMNQNQKEFEVIMDALRLGSPSPTPSVGSDTCGQAAMMSETNGGVFHNLVVTSLET